MQKKGRAVFVMEQENRVGKKNPCKTSIRQNSLGVIRRKERLRDRGETDGQKMKLLIAHKREVMILSQKEKK